MRSRIQTDLILAFLLLAGMSFPASVAARCVVSVQDMNFGAYDPSSPAPTNGIADYVLDCRTPVLVTVEIGPSATTGSTADRRMRHVARAETLSYNLFRDTAMTQVWGDSSGNASKVQKIEGQVVGRIYGQIFPGQDAWIGEYADTLRVTILP